MKTTRWSWAWVPFRAFLTALLCVGLFRTSTLLGAGLSSPLFASVALETATYVAPFSIGLLRHTCEALFMVSAIYFLIAGDKAPSPSKQLWAGVMLEILLPVRRAIARYSYHERPAWR